MSSLRSLASLRLLAFTVLCVAQSGGSASGDDEAGVPGAGTGELPLLFQADFSQGRADGWYPSDPEGWQVVQRGGQWVYALLRPCQYQPPVRAPRNISVLGEPAVTDFRLEARLRSTTEDYPHRDMCVLFGYQDPAHHYYAHLGKRADPHSNSVFIVDATPRVSIATYRTEGTLWDDEAHLVRVERNVVSGAIRVYFDDMLNPVMTAQDTTFTWGHVGIGSFDDTGDIIEVRLWGRKAEGKKGRLP